MKAITYEDGGRISFNDVAEPSSLERDEVLVQVEMTGICGTDHKILGGQYDLVKPGVVLGHEGVGTVVDVGELVTHLAINDRVVINPTQSCLNCRQCRLGNLCYCEAFGAHQLGFSVDGTFTRLLKTGARWVYRMPADMPWEVGALIEPFGCSINGIARAQLRPHESVAVIGSGPIGVMCQMIAARQARLTVSTDLSEYRREFSSRAVTHALHPRELTPRKVESMTGEPGFDVVIDAVGNQLELALSLTNKGGRVVAMGCDDRYSASISPTRLIDDGISIVANVTYHDAIGPALDTAKSYPMLNDLVTDVLDFEDFEEAFARTMGRDRRSGETVEVRSMKAVIKS